MYILWVCWIVESFGCWVFYVGIIVVLVVLVWFVICGYFDGIVNIFNIVLLDVILVVVFVVGGDMLFVVLVLVSLELFKLVVLYLVLFIFVLCLVSMVVLVGVLILQFKGDSWVDIVVFDGIIVEKVLVKFGEICSFMLGQVVCMVLGNVLVVEVQQGGIIVDFLLYQ